MFEKQSDYVKNGCENISKLIDDIYYHRLTHEQIICYVKELYNQLQTASQETRILKSNRLTMFEKLDIIQQNKKMREGFINLIKIDETDCDNTECKNCPMDNKCFNARYYYEQSLREE